MKEAIIDKISRIGLFTTCLALLMGLCCCSDQSPKSRDQTFPLHHDIGDTSILLLEDGVCRPLDEKEMTALCDQFTTLVKKEIAADSAPKTTQFSLQEVSLSYRPVFQQRLTALFEDAAYLQAGHVSFERQIFCDPLVPASAKKAAQDAVEAAYALSSTGASAILADPGLSIPGTGRYAAVMFIPRVYTIQGVFVIGPNSYPVEIVYPCLNALNVMDGIYYVREEDSLEAFS